MIRNLNQINFQPFGNIQPDRERTANLGDAQTSLQLNFDDETTDIYYTEQATHMRVSSGTCVLSVSLDGENFQHFYFDKPVCIKANIYFSLSAFKGNTCVSVYSVLLPGKTGSRPNASLRMNQRIRTEGIYTFFYQERERGFIYSGEEHPMPELTYVDQGALHSVTDGQDILLLPGDIAFFGPNQWHMHYADMDVAPRYVTISFDLEGVDITPLLNRKFAAPQQAIKLIQQMLQEQERMDDYSPDMILSQLNQLVLILLRFADAPAAKRKASNAIHSENEIISRAQQYISTHVREKLSVPLVARMVDVSPSYLTALFHKNLQISPGEYIRRIKLQESKQMIRQDNLNFTEIAAALQYSTVHHFSRQFKEKFGITPSEYAKSVR